MNEIKLNVPLVSQGNDGTKDGWGHRLCGLASLAMVLRYKKIDPGSLEELLAKGLGMGAYLDGVGWRHQGLVDVANSFDLEMSFIKQFPKTPEEKQEKEEIIISSLRNGNPVIASMRFKFTPEGQSHLVVVHGVNEGGYYIQDPDNFRSGSHNYFVERDDFINSWRGGLIYINQ